MSSAATGRLPRRWTPREVIEWTAGYLGERGIDNPRGNAERLLGHALGVTRIQLYLDLDRPLSEAERTSFKELIRRRAGGEPLQYILGHQPFRYLDLAVAPGVLIPRPETEILVDEAMSHLRRLSSDHASVGPNEQITVLDIGTGSGAIALSIAHESGLGGVSAKVIAVDISADALSIAHANAEALSLAGSVEFRQGHLAAGLPDDSVDLLVSNPPYIKSVDIELLSAEIREHEPRTALDGGPDGLRVITELIEEATRVVRRSGGFAVEIGAGQAPEVADMLKKAGWNDVRIVDDLTGIQRVVTGVA